MTRPDQIRVRSASRVPYLSSRAGARTSARRREISARLPSYENSARLPSYGGAPSEEPPCEAPPLRFGESSPAGYPAFLRSGTHVSEGGPAPDRSGPGERPPSCQGRARLRRTAGRGAGGPRLSESGSGWRTGSGPRRGGVEALDFQPAQGGWGGGVAGREGGRGGVWFWGLDGEGVGGLLSDHRAGVSCLLDSELRRRA